MPIEQLYGIYGQLMIEGEILQSKIAQVKQEIVNVMNASKAETKSTEEVQNGEAA